MRTSEWIIVGLLAFLMLLAWVRPLGWRRRLTVTARSALGAALLVALAYGDGLFSAQIADALRNWLPAAFLLVVYWQVGEFYSGPRIKLQEWLLRTDVQIFAFFKRVRAGEYATRHGRTGALYLEFCYLLCYPLVPAGLAALYFTRGNPDADAFWTLVLVPTYLCDLTVVFFPVLPPRAVEPQPPLDIPVTALRRLNLWILRHGSIQVNTFPSAHVASTLATALAVLAQAPAIGALFLIIALSIALAAVLGRYHYALDALLAAALVLAWFWILSLLST